MVEEEENIAKKKYEFLEDLPGIGPATAQKLQELGFHTVEALAMAAARELEPAGIGEKKALAIIGAARSSRLAARFWIGFLAGGWRLKP